MLLSDKLFGVDIPKKMLYLLMAMLITYCLLFTEYNYLILIVGYLIVAVKDVITFRNVCICYLAFTLGISIEFDLTFITLVAMVFSIVCMIYNKENIKYYALVGLVFTCFMVVDLGIEHYQSKAINELTIKEEKFATILENWTDKDFYMQALEKDDVSSFVKN